MSTTSDAAPRSISVLAAQISDGLYRALLETAARQGDLNVVGRASHPLDTLLAAAAAVDIVVLEAQSQPGIVGHLLGEYPELKLVVFHPPGRATVYWRGLRQRELTAVDLSQLELPLREAYAIEPTL